jgi:hypothetical protein
MRLRSARHLEPSGAVSFARLSIFETSLAGLCGSSTAAAAFALLLLVPTAVCAQDTFTIPAVAVRPGAAEIAIPILADTKSDITGLNLEVDFDPRLCDLIDEQRIEIPDRVRLTDAQVTIDPSEQIGCPQDGRLSIVLIDLALNDERGASVVPAGHGEIARWVMSVRDDASLETFPLTLHVNDARNGPRSLEFAVESGRVTTTHCRGDCNADGHVGIDDLISAVNVALGIEPPVKCLAFGHNPTNDVTIYDIVTAVSDSMDGCPK